MKFKDFKKIASGKDKTVFKHQNGSFLHVAHKGLDPKHKKALDALPCFAEGGDTEDKPSAWQNFKNDAYSAADDMGLVDNTVPPKQSGPDFASQYNATPDDAAARQSASGAKFGMSQNTLNGINQFPIPSGQQDAPGAAPPTDAQSPYVAPDREPADVSPPQESPDAPAVNQSTGAPAPQPSAETAQPEAAPVSMKDDLHNENAAWQQDLANGHIKPETYGDLFAKRSTLGKIGMMFGMLLGGMGSGLTKQPNAVLAMMNNEIGNDLEAQKQSKSNAQNFLRIHQSQEMNNAQIKHLGQQGALTEAQTGHVGAENALTAAQTKGALAEADIKAQAGARMKMIAAAMHDQVLRVNAMPDGPQKEQAKQVLGMMSTATGSEYANIADQAQARASLLNSINGPTSGTTGMRMIPGMEGVANDIDSKTIPGLGRAQVPLTSQDRESINGGIGFQQELDRFMDWTKKHSGSLDPKAIAEGQSLSGQLNNAYRQATHGGVYKESENGFIGKMIDSDPTKFFNSIRVLPKLQAVKNESSAQLNQLLGSKGLPNYKGAMASSAPNMDAQAMAWAKANPGDPRAAKIMQRFGKR